MHAQNLILMGGWKTIAVVLTTPITSFSFEVPKNHCSVIHMFFLSGRSLNERSVLQQAPYDQV